MSPLRIGNFTSSDISALLANGKAAGSMGVKALTYIDECNMERRLGRALDSDTDARPLSWGNLLEARAFDLLGLEYKLCSTETLSHPTIEYWKGSPDALKGETVADIKCPITLKSFCQLVDGGTIEAVRNNHPQGEKYYWQIVSNAILTNCTYGELIIYVPYKSELEQIRELAQNNDGQKQHRFMWVALAPDDELPHLLDGGHYKNLNVIRFEISQADKMLLAERVIQGGQLLTPYQLSLCK